MKLSIIIPCFNEEKTIAELINKIFNLDIKKQVIVIDDKSNDNSRDIIEKHKHKVDKIIYHEKNLGKGGAIISAKKFIEGDYVVIQDADLEYFPEDIVEMFELAKKNENSLILGSRFKGNKERKNIYKRTYYANKLMSFFFSIVHNYKVSDIATCYKLFPQNFFTSVNFVEKGFSIEIEIISKFLKYNKSIVESPIRYEGRSYSEGKKIKLLDGVYYLLNTIKYKFVS